MRRCHCLQGLKVLDKTTSPSTSAHLYNYKYLQVLFIRISIAKKIPGGSWQEKTRTFHGLTRQVLASCLACSTSTPTGLTPGLLCPAQDPLSGAPSNVSHQKRGVWEPVRAVTPGRGSGSVRAPGPGPACLLQQHHNMHSPPLLFTHSYRC